VDEQRYAEFAKGRFDVLSGSKMSRIRRDAGHAILDVGCGPGTYLRALQDLGYAVSGVEHNRIMAEQARLITSDVYVADVETDGLSRFDDRSFDTVLMLDVVEHLHDDIAALREGHRVCRKNVIVSVPARKPEGLGTQLSLGTYDDPTHLHYYTRADLAALLHAAGFARYRIDYLMRLDPLLYQLFPAHLQRPLTFLNRCLLKIADMNRLTTVWYAVGAR
jgi:SAM-dependent methyltransferase